MSYKIKNLKLGPLVLLLLFCLCPNIVFGALITNITDDAVNPAGATLNITLPRSAGGTLWVGISTDAENHSAINNGVVYTDQNSTRAWAIDPNTNYTQGINNGTIYLNGKDSIALNANDISSNHTNTANGNIYMNATGTFGVYATARDNIAINDGNISILGFNGTAMYSIGLNNNLTNNNYIFINSTGPSIGMYANETGSNLVNNQDIIVDGVGHSNAMDGRGDSASTVNNGHIVVYSDSSAAVFGSAGTLNTGRINIDGSNSLGISTEGVGSFVAKNIGVIDVNGTGSVGLGLYDANKTAINSGDIFLIGDQPFGFYIAGTNQTAINSGNIIGYANFEKFGMYSVASNSILRNTATGNITMSGSVSSAGMMSEAINATLINDGLISMHGNNSYPMYSTQPGSSIINNGQLLLSADQSDGLWALGLGSTVYNSATGIVNITETVSPNANFGMVMEFAATGINDGLVVVNASGGGMLAGYGYSRPAVGVDAVNNGKIIVDTPNKSMPTYGMQAFGSYQDIMINNGVIESYGTGGGMFAGNSYGTMYNTGNISVAGNNSFGMLGFDSFFVNNVTGEIRTSGENATGMQGINRPNNGTLWNNGTIITTGLHADGIKIDNGTAKNTGNISVGNSVGMHSMVDGLILNFGSINVNSSVINSGAYGMYANISELVNNANITLQGVGGIGISGSRNIDISLSGTENAATGRILVNSVQGVGIETRGENTASVNNGIIDVTGKGATGMFYSNKGQVGTNNGIINVAGTGATGMLFSNNSQVGVNNGNITVGNGGIGILINAPYNESSPAVVTNTNSGIIRATGSGIAVLVENDNDFHNLGSIYSDDIAVEMGVGNNRLYLDSGSNIHCLLDGGIGEDTLILGQNSSSGGTIAAEFCNFGHIRTVNGSWVQAGIGEISAFTESPTTPGKDALQPASLMSGVYTIASGAILRMPVDNRALSVSQSYVTSNGGVGLEAVNGTGIGTIVADSIHINGKALYIVDESLLNLIAKNVDEIRILNLFTNNPVTGLENIQALLPTPFDWIVSGYTNSTQGGLMLKHSSVVGGNGIDLPTAFGQSIYEYPRNKVEQDLTKMIRDEAYNYASMNLTLGWHQMGHMFGVLGGYHSNAVSGYIADAKQDDVRDVAYNYNTYGLYGVTQYNGENIILGANYGAAWSDVDYDDYGQSTENMNYYFVGLYGKYSPSRKWDILAQLGYMYTDHSLERGIIENSGPYANNRMQLEGEFGSQEFSAALDIKYNIDVAKDWVLSPLVGVNYAYIYEDSYNESPFDASKLGNWGLADGQRNMWYAMHIGSCDYGSLVSRLGVAVKYIEKGTEFRGSLVWEHEFLDRSADKSGHFLFQDYMTPGHRYEGEIDALQMGRDSLIINLGLSFPMSENWEFTVDYKGEMNLQADYNQHAGQIGLTYEF